MSDNFYRSEDQDGSKNRWIEDTHQFRREAVEVREQIPAEMVRTPPYRVPDLVDYYNRMIHKYASQLRPKFPSSDDHLGAGGEGAETIPARLWQKELARVEVPKDGSEIHAGKANVHGEVDVEKPLKRLPTTEKVVSLDKLLDWRDSMVTFDIVYRDRREGECRTRRHEVLYLPVWAADRCLDQLNICLEDLGWLPKAAEKDIKALEPPSSP